MTKNQQNTEKKSSIPFGIIGGVLAIVVIGGFLLYQSSKTPSDQGSKTPGAKTPAAKTPDNAAQVYASAPPGATPPHMLGSPSASVTVEEFADFQCPTCASVHNVMKNLQSVYGSQIKFVFRHFPLSSIHAKAYDAAVASEAAGQQGKFWDMQNLIFLNQQTWATAADHRALFADYAQRIGLDVERFKDDMLGMSAKSRVDADIQRGRALAINSTPSVFINGRLIPYEQMSTLEALRQVIDAEMDRVSGKKAETPAENANTGDKGNSSK